MWTLWLAAVGLSFAALEAWRIHTGKPTLSRATWVLSKQWPPLPWLVGLVVGFLAAHFFWIGEGCDLVK